MYVPVQMFHRLPVGESGVCLQDHKGDLCGRTESVPASQGRRSDRPAAFAIHSNGKTE